MAKKVGVKAAGKKSSAKLDKSSSSDVSSNASSNNLNVTNESPVKGGNNQENSSSAHFDLSLVKQEVVDYEYIETSRLNETTNLLARGNSASNVSSSSKFVNSANSKLNFYFL